MAKTTKNKNNARNANTPPSPRRAYLEMIWGLRQVYRQDILRAANRGIQFIGNNRKTWWQVRPTLLDPSKLTRPWTELELALPTDTRAILAGLAIYKLIPESEWNFMVNTIMGALSDMAFTTLSDLVNRN